MNGTKELVDRRLLDLNSPKVIDILKNQPAYVKDGMVYDFHDVAICRDHTKGGDCIIFDGEKGLARVKSVQAVTSALKRDYTKACTLWNNGGVDAELPEEKEDVVKKPKKKAKTSKGNDDRPEPTEVSTKFDLVGTVESLLSDGKLKKAKKLIGEHEDDADYKKAKKLLKKASK